MTNLRSSTSGCKDIEIIKSEFVERIQFQFLFRVVQHTAANNLFFGLRGAGSSLAIVTEFLYTIHKEPETR